MLGNASNSAWNSKFAKSWGTPAWTGTQGQTFLSGLSRRSQGLGGGSLSSGSLSSGSLSKGSLGAISLPKLTPEQAAKVEQGQTATNPAKIEEFATKLAKEGVEAFKAGNYLVAAALFDASMSIREDSTVEFNLARSYQLEALEAEDAENLEMAKELAETALGVFKTAASLASQPDIPGLDGDLEAAKLQIESTQGYLDYLELISSETPQNTSEIKEAKQSASLEKQKLKTAGLSGDGGSGGSMSILAGIALLGVVGYYLKFGKK